MKGFLAQAPLGALLLVAAATATAQQHGTGHGTAHGAQPALGAPLPPGGNPPPPVVVGEGARVSFELFRGNRIFLDARVNGRAVAVMLDTGASSTVLDRTYARSIGIPEGRKVQGRGAGGPVEAELVENVSLEIAGLRFDGMTIGVMDLQPIARALGRPLPVVVGRELFNAAAVGIDWNSAQLSVVPAGNFRIPAGATELPVERRGPFNFVKISVAGLAPIDALLDLGNGGAVILPSDYWAKQPLLAALPFAEGRAGGVGGVHPTRSVTLPAVEFGGRRFSGVPAMFSGDSQGGNPAHSANVGIELLKQFAVTLDLGRNRIFLAPTGRPAQFQRDRAGLRADFDGQALVATFVSPQGPAAAAGLKQGDRIVAINGTPVTADSFRHFSRWQSADPGTEVELQRADGARLKFRLRDYY